MTLRLFLKRKAIGLLYSLWLAISINGLAQQSESKANRQPYSLVITPKIHSAGYSPYSGNYYNRHSNLELNVTFKYKQMGAFVSKYVDVVDSKSPVNFATAGIFRSFQITDRLKFTPYVGYFLAQKSSFMDKSSDLWTGFVAKVEINEWIWIENTLLASNLLHHTATTSLANRLNVAIMISKFQLDAYTWYNHSFHTALHFVSASVALTSPEWALSRSVSMKIQVAVLQQIAHEKPDGTFNRGLVVSLIVPVDLSPK